MRCAVPYRARTAAVCNHSLALYFIFNSAVSRSSIEITPTSPLSPCIPLAQACLSPCFFCVRAAFLSLYLFLLLHSQTDYSLTLPPPPSFLSLASPYRSRSFLSALAADSSHSFQLAVAISPFLYSSHSRHNRINRLNRPHSAC